jgi:acyl-CoA thioesterase YciA
LAQAATAVAPHAERSVGKSGDTFKESMMTNSLVSSSAMRRDLTPPPAPTHRELTLRVVPMPADVNAAGDIFGGWVMAQVDIAGSILPFRIAGGRIATVAVNQFIFKQPVRVGDLLSFYAEIVKVGRTSITVEVEVWAQRLRNQEELVKVTEATLTYVAVDAQGTPRPVPR